MRAAPNGPAICHGHPRPALAVHADTGDVPAAMGRRRRLQVVGNGASPTARRVVRRIEVSATEEVTSAVIPNAKTAPAQRQFTCSLADLPGCTIRSSSPVPENAPPRRLRSMA